METETKLNFLAIIMGACVIGMFTVLANVIGFVTAIAFILVAYGLYSEDE